MLAKDDPILILGAGTFGLSTAYTLAAAGHTKVTVLDRDSIVPSRFSAGYDLNKVVRCDYVDSFYTDLTLRAVRKWQTDPLYQPHFQQVGFLNAITGEAPDTAKNAIAKYYKSVSERSAFDGLIETFDNAAEIKNYATHYTGDLPGWKGYINKLAGYAHSTNAMDAVYKACKRLGVAFKLGPVEGEAAELLYDAPASSAGRKCIGVRTRGGVEYRAAVTILALGGHVSSLLPAITSHVYAVCWGVAHIQLTPKESEQLRGMPVTSVRDIGFFFEPDPATHKFKICYMGGGYTNFSVDKASGSKISQPYATLGESEYIPQRDIEEARRLLRQVLPHIAERPFIDCHLCWVADTADSNFIIDFVPGAGQSLVVLSGDSGHGFKMMPIMGELTMDLLAAGEQKTKRWCWKETKSENSTPKQIVWRAAETVDLSTVSRARL